MSPSRISTTNMAPPNKTLGKTPGEWCVADVPQNELQRHVAAWDDLAQAASEPNVFYEAWHLLPALRAFGENADLRFLFVYAPPDERGEAPLCGFFPFEKRAQYKNLPTRLLTLWQHDYSSLCTPLLRSGYERQTLDALLTWMNRQRGGAALVEWPRVSANGPFNSALGEVCAARRFLSFTDDRYDRALLQPGAQKGRDFDTYLRQALSRKRRKELKRLENRLAEFGRLEYDLLRAGEADRERIARWIEEFLRLEASGWKGRAGTAFINRERDGAFFRSMARAAAERGQLSMLALRLNGTPLAMKFNLHSGKGAGAPGAFACKIAFDEDYSRFSPGVLLELENIRQMHIAPVAPWMDSCAIRDHFMINRLWLERRAIQNIVVSVSKGSGDMVVSLLPLLRRVKQSVKQKLKRQPQGHAPANATTPDDEGEES